MKKRYRVISINHEQCGAVQFQVNSFGLLSIHFPLGYFNVHESEYRREFAPSCALATFTSFVRASVKFALLSLQNLLGGGQQTSFRC